MATHSSTLAWKIPWTEEPGRLQSMGSLSPAWLSDFTFTFHFHALEKEMATHSSVLAWRIPGTEEPDGLPSVGLHRVGHYWSDLAAAVACLLPGHPVSNYPQHWAWHFMPILESRFSRLSRMYTKVNLHWILPKGNLWLEENNWIFVVIWKE